VSEPRTLREAIEALNAELRSKKAEAESILRSLVDYRRCVSSSGPRDGCWHDGHSRRFCERHKYLEGGALDPKLPAITLENITTRIEQALQLPDRPEASATGSDSAARPT